MDNQKMELRKLRDFSENLNDTFQFIRQEFKPLLGSFLAICGVFIILSGIVGGIYQQGNIGNVLNAFKGIGNKRQGFSEVFNMYYFLVLFFGVFNYVLMHVVLAAYFKVYEAKGKVSPTIEEVWNMTLKYIVSQFLFSIVYFLIIIISILPCGIPFFYFGVVFAPFTMIYVMEDCSFGTGFNRCFALIKDNYWMSLAIYIVAIIIYYFGTLIIGVFTGIIALVINYFSVKDIAATVGIITSIVSVFSHLFYIIFFVTVALNYFNLAEQLDGDGLMQRIDSIGSNETDAVQEEY